MNAAAWFGQRLREIRDNAGLTRQALATRASVSVRAIVQWELGTREPSWSNVIRLSEALEVSVTEFLKAPQFPEKPRVNGRPPKGVAREGNDSASGSSSTTTSLPRADVSPGKGKRGKRSKESK